MLGQVDDWAETDPTQWNTGLVVADNNISHTSLEYRGSPAGAHPSPMTCHHSPPSF